MVMRTGTALLAAIVLLTGCGHLLVHGPPEYHQELDYVECTTNDLWPWVDVALAGLNAGSTVGYLLLTDESVIGVDAAGSIATARTLLVVSGALWTGVHVSGAIVGFGKTEACREAKLEAALRRQAADGNTK